jgi:anti-sigma regulatory factor (Ser/Thr protein kinase)
MAQLRTEVIRNLDADVTTVRVGGVLSLETAADMRAVLLKVIAECPSTVIVDVGDCTAAHPAALTVFPAVTRHHAWQPAVAVLLGGADPDFLAHGGRAALGNVPAFASAEKAAAAAAAAETRTGQERVIFAPAADPQGPGQARAVICEACRRWGLPQLEVPAALVVSELVTNAIMHANGRVLLEAAVRGVFVHIRVHDASDREPVLGPPLDQADVRHDRGRGLRLIERYCSAWGFLPRSDGLGKVVWATLRARPVGAG